MTRLLSRLTRPSGFLLTLMVGVALFGMPLIAMAQDDENAPPAPVLRQSPPQWVGFGIMFVLFVAVLFLSLMSSKRSHQD